MNKSEVAEIKKTFTKETCSVDRFSACLVDDEKNKTYVTTEALLSLPEEELARYLDIFHKALSGTLGKNLINIDFPTDSEIGGPASKLLKLRDSALKDDGINEEFFDSIIKSYQFEGRYYIIAAHASYDVPGKAKDNTIIDDGSENVFEYILTCICPVNLAKPALGYDEEQQKIGELTRDWVVSAPDKAFLFPAFEDRAANVHRALYYSKKAEELMPDFTDAIFGTTGPLTAGMQSDAFNTLITETVGETVDMDILQNVADNINEMVEDNKHSKEPVDTIELAAPEVKKLLSKSGVSDEELESFDETYDKIAGSDNKIVVSNLSSVKQFTVATPQIVIRAKPEATQLIEHKLIDGRMCLVIPVTSGIEVNGIPAAVTDSES